MLSDQIGNNGTWPYEGDPGQAEPTVDTNDILSEPCEPTLGNQWPRGCALGSSLTDYQPYLISKGIFERAIYCSNQNLNDPVIFPTQASILGGLDADLGVSYAMC